MDEREAYDQPSNHGQQEQYMKVVVSKVTHFTRADDFNLTDINGCHKTTSKLHWERESYNGHTAWVYRGKGRPTIPVRGFSNNTLQIS
jgi:hypothetical protein